MADMGTKEAAEKVYGGCRAISALGLGGRLRVIAFDKAGTTEQFLRSFGVKSLEELPEINPVQLEEFKVQAEEEVQLTLNI